jgi:hypothetical protein
MKLTTNQVVTLTNEEAIKFLTKLIEKKTGKKVEKVTEPFEFHLQTEESTLEEKAGV